MERTLGLYLHFPFCVRKCLYCDFLSFPADRDAQRLYASALAREIRASGRAADGITVTSIFLGGGTPSVMPAGALRDIFRAVFDSFRVSKDAEITMEMNPGTVNEANLRFAFAYLNRVSLGVQSFSDAELQRLGRIHSASEAERSFRMLREAGIRNINLDLMQAIPGQTLQSWEETLRTAAGLGPEHLSAYSLIVEEGTPFSEMSRRGELALPDEDAEREMYYRTREILSGYGYERYEISNYARPGYRCRHNVRYWTRGEYLGLGLGASSFLGGKRWKNTSDFREYCEGSASPLTLMRSPETIDRKSAAEEFMFLGLRMTEGVSEQAFRESFGIEMEDLYGKVLAKLREEGLIRPYRAERGLKSAAGALSASSDRRWQLTDRGIDISNAVLAEFLLD